MKKDVCLTNGRLGFGQKNEQKNKNLSMLHNYDKKRWGLNEWQNRIQTDYSGSRTNGKIVLWKKKMGFRQRVEQYQI